MNQSSAITANSIKSFEEFWPYYIREHSHPANRMLHFIGSSLGLICLVFAVVVGNPWLVILSLVIGYAFAWFGHFFIERNRPATFKYPLWSFRADWKMWLLTLTGKMKNEVRRAMENA